MLPKLALEKTTTHMRPLTKRLTKRQFKFALESHQTKWKVSQSFGKSLPIAKRRKLVNRLPTCFYSFTRKWTSTLKTWSHLSRTSSCRVAYSLSRKRKLRLRVDLRRSKRLLIKHMRRYIRAMQLLLRSRRFYLLRRGESSHASHTSKCSFLTLSEMAHITLFRTAR